MIACTFGISAFRFSRFLSTTMLSASMSYRNTFSIFFDAGLTFRGTPISMMNSGLFERCFITFCTSSG